MPIYEYQCNSCGVKKEHIQKMSDAPIAVCPACGSEDYTKLVSAAGFQLKGSGWYVTDFKNKSSQSTAKSDSDSGGDKTAAADSTTDKKSDTTDKTPAVKSSESTTNKTAAAND